jgi:hypothetical protein
MLSKIDIFSLPITLKYKNKETYGTNMGGGLTVIAMILIIILVNIKSNPTIVIKPHNHADHQIEYQSRYEKVDLGNFIETNDLSKALTELKITEKTFISLEAESDVNSSW